MNPELERLVRLQRAETELRRLESELAEVPRRKSEMEAALARDRGRLDAGKEALDLCQKNRRRHEAELQDLEAKRSRYKSQLMEVKTNKEYTAMLHEIEAVEREIRSREDQILLEMERAEGLQTEVKRETEDFAGTEARHRSDVAELEERSRAGEEEVQRMRAERDAIASTVGAGALQLFQRVVRLRGVAVAQARDGTCQVCHVKLRPQMYVDLKRNEEIVQCPACSRILYYEVPVTAASPDS